MTARKGIALLMTICLLAASSVSAFAQSQTTGRIAGTVKDQSGAVIAGAQVGVVSRATGDERKATSDEGGNFLVPLLPPGTYQVSVVATGFKKAIFDQIQVAITETTPVNADLEVGAVTEESINVTAGAPLVQ